MSEMQRNEFNYKYEPVGIRSNVGDNKRNENS